MKTCKKSTKNLKNQDNEDNNTTIITISFAMKVFGQCLETEQAFKDYFIANIPTIDPIEGVWSVNSTVKIYNRYNELENTKYTPQAATIAIIKNGDKFLGCTITREGKDIGKITFSKTTLSNIYLYNQNFYGTNTVAKANVVFSSESLLEYSYEVPTEQLKYLLGDKYVKGTSVITEINSHILLFQQQQN